MSEGRLCIPDNVKTTEDLVSNVLYAACMSLWDDHEKCTDPKVLEEIAREFDPDEDWDEEYYDEDDY